LRGKANFYIDLYLYYLSVKSKDASICFNKINELYDKSTSVITKVYSNINPGVAHNNMLKGLVEIYNERPNEAFNYLFKAKHSLATITTNGNHITSNNSLLLTCYTYLNYAYALKYKQTSDLAILKQSVVTNKESIPYFLEYIQQLNLNNKALRDPYSINPFSTITGLYIKLYQHTKNINYIDSAFVFADKSKQLSLLVHKQQSSLFTEVDINKKLMASEQFILFNNTNEFDKLYTLKTQIKRDLKTISLNNLQHNIKNNEAVICYADAHPNLGNGLLVAFVITKHTKELIILEDPYYDSKITTTAITHNSMFSLLKDSMPVAFNKFSYSVYSRYFKPINHLLDTTIKHLYILPNEGLNNIPFEILTTTENKTNSFLNNNYLLNKYTISYQLSATIGWEVNYQASLNNHTIKIFAPELAKFKLSDLPFCKKMANELNQTYKNCELITPSLANDFNKNISTDNAIIQLYTHSAVDQNNESNSKIYFSDRQLYMSEIYKMKVKSPLVFLSSCETDWGWHERYDGQLNFTRALFYAGASSVISSFWKTDDKTTAIITQKFYEYLAQGNNKGIALQKAKLDFIKENPQLNNPMYWTAFKLTGNIDCIKIEKKQYLAFLVGLLIILLASIFLFKRFYKK
jgi:CHAT domain-containing protein